MSLIEWACRLGAREVWENDLLFWTNLTIAVTTTIIASTMIYLWFQRRDDVGSNNPTVMLIFSSYLLTCGLGRLMRAILDEELQPRIIAPFDIISAILGIVACFAVPRAIYYVLKLPKITAIEKERREKDALARENEKLFKENQFKANLITTIINVNNRLETVNKELSNKKPLDDSIRELQALSKSAG